MYSKERWLKIKVEFNYKKSTTDEIYAVNKNAEVIFLADEDLNRFIGLSVDDAKEIIPKLQKMIDYFDKIWHLLGG